MSIDQCTVSSGLIIPDNIPGDDLKPYQLEQVASSLRSVGASAVTQAEAAETSWAGLPAVLESPQGPTIYAALGTPSTTARTVESKFGRVADALDEFAAAVRPIKQTFSTIKTDAIAFRATIRADERVWVSPRETKEYEGNGLAVVSSTSYSTSYSTGSSQSDVLSYLRGRGETARAWGGQVQILAHWTESSEHVDTNNALMDRLADAYTLLQNAEADCANAINRQRNMCLVDVEHIEAWQLKQSGENTAMLPWGNRVDEDRNCGESFWWGVGSAGGETLEGLGTLIGRDPLSGEFSWEMAGQGWLGAVQGIGSLVVLASPPLYLLGLAGVPVLKEGANMGNEMIKGLVAWDTWSENPSEAFGRVVFNVGTMFIPGAGQVGAAIKGLTAGARVLDAAADASRFSTAVLNGIAKLDTLVVKIDNLIGDAATTVRTSIDDLVPSGWKGNGPDGDLLHVGARSGDSPGPPLGVVDEAAPRNPVDAPDVNGNGWTRTTAEAEGAPRLEGGDGRPYPGHHGDSGTPPPTASANPAVQATLDLRADPAAMYGRNPDGTPMGKAAYDERFVLPNGDPRYPSYDGAVPGTRVTYTDPVSFINDHGMKFDRVGYPGGEYVSVMENGIPATFEARGLPVSSLGKPYTPYALSPDAAMRMTQDGIEIQVSRVAPAFGQPGGALQALFFRPEGGRLVRMTTQDVIDAGYFR